MCVQIPHFSQILPLCSNPPHSSQVKGKGSDRLHHRRLHWSDGFAAVAADDAAVAAAAAAAAAAVVEVAVPRASGLVSKNVMKQSINAYRRRVMDVAIMNWQEMVITVFIVSSSR